MDNGKLVSVFSVSPHPEAEVTGRGRQPEQGGMVPDVSGVGPRPAVARGSDGVDNVAVQSPHCQLVSSSGHAEHGGRGVDGAAKIQTLLTPLQNQMEQN